MRTFTGKNLVHGGPYLVDSMSPAANPAHRSPIAAREGDPGSVPTIIPAGIRWRFVEEALAPAAPPCRRRREGRAEGSGLRGEAKITGGDQSEEL
jgi:hypothetical protein